MSFIYSFAFCSASLLTCAKLLASAICQIKLISEWDQFVNTDPIVCRVDVCTELHKIVLAEIKRKCYTTEVFCSEKVAGQQ